MTTATKNVTEEDAFQAAIDANPRDGLVRLVFADWLDEHGRHGEAAWYRLEGQTGCRPTIGRFPGPAETSYPGFWMMNEYVDWWSENELAEIISSRIPEKLFLAIYPDRKSPVTGGSWWRTRSARRDIESAAALAFAGLDAHEQAEVERDIRSYPRCSTARRNQPDETDEQVTTWMWADGHWRAAVEDVLGIRAFDPARVCNLCPEPMGDEAGENHARCEAIEAMLADRDPR